MAYDADQSPDFIQRQRLTKLLRLGRALVNLRGRETDTLKFNHAHWTRIDANENLISVCPLGMAGARKIGGFSTWRGRLTHQGPSHRRFVWPAAGDVGQTIDGVAWTSASLNEVYQRASYEFGVTRKEAVQLFSGDHSYYTARFEHMTSDCVGLKIVDLATERLLELTPEPEHELELA